MAANIMVNTGYERIPFSFTFEIKEVTDADTYAIYFYYKQVENIVWLQDAVNRRKDYYILQNN